MSVADRLRKGQQAGPRRAAAGSARAADGVFSQLYGEVVDRLDSRQLAQLDAKELRERIGTIVAQVAHARDLELSATAQNQLVSEIVDEIMGLGPLEVLLEDPDITDILVNGYDSIYIEREGVLHPSQIKFRDNAHLLNTINRIVATLGRRIDEASPMVDARLPDGSRVHAVIPPLAIDGPALSIRRFGKTPISFKEMVAKGSLTTEMVHYFRCAVRSRLNILIAGGTGAGKTSLLNALSGYISSRERIITIEDSAELQLQQRHVVRLEARPPNIEGRGEVSIRELVRNALRMRPDRIIVGEVRADEVLDMVQAMNTGHDGSMTTVHANSVHDAFTRLISMLSMSGTPLTEALMIQMVARALDVVIHVVRGADGKRRITEVAEVDEVADGTIQTHTVFSHKGGSSAARWHCAGTSRYLARFEAAGVPLDPRALGTQS